MNLDAKVEPKLHKLDSKDPRIDSKQCVWINSSNNTKRLKITKAISFCFRLIVMTLYVNECMFLCKDKLYAPHTYTHYRRNFKLFNCYHFNNWVQAVQIYITCGNILEFYLQKQAFFKKFIATFIYLSTYIYA